MNEGGVDGAKVSKWIAWAFLLLVAWFGYVAYGEITRPQRPIVKAAPLPEPPPTRLQAEPSYTVDVASQNRAREEEAERLRLKESIERSQTETASSGASAVCADGTLSYSAHRRGTCSHHGGVARWL